MERWTSGWSRAASCTLLTTIMLTACSDDDATTASNTPTTQPGTTTAIPPTSGDSKTNTAPLISGTPTVAVAAGEPYSFKPVARDANGDPLTFSVANRPRWLAFDASNGTLSGTPSAADVGTYQRLMIIVSDGKAASALGPFDIAVQVGSGAAPGPGVTGTKGVALSWSVPTEYEDGTVFADLAGYRIRYGRSPGSYTNLVEIAPGTTSHDVHSLDATTYYFSITAFNYSGIESALSNEVAVALN